MIGRIAVRGLLSAIGLMVLALIVLTLAGALYQPNTDIPAGFAGRHVNVNGARLRVLQRGVGRDVLLIHGSPGSIEDWEPVIDALAGSFRLTAYDRPGHGFSADLGEYSYERNAKVALQVIDALRLENVVVVGHSYGGATALAMAIRRPATVSAYVIIDSAAYEPSRSAGGVYSLLAVPWLGTGVARVLGPLRAERRIEHGITEVSGWRKPDPAFVAARTLIWSSPKVAHAIAEEMLGAPAELRSLSAQYPAIRRPTYVLAQADNAFRRATGQHLQHDVPGSVLGLVPGTGHYVQFDQPSVVVDTIKEAARSTAAAPSASP